MKEQQLETKLTTFPSRLYAGKETQKIMAEMTISVEDELRAMLDQGTKELVAERLAKAGQESSHTPTKKKEAKSDDKEEKEKREQEEAKVKFTLLGPDAEEREALLEQGTDAEYQSGLVKEWSAIRDNAHSHLQSWDKTRLREAWLTWSDYNPQEMLPSYAKAREEVRQCLREIAEQKGVIGYLTTGEEFEAASPLQLAEVDASEVTEENASVGREYGSFIRESHKQRSLLELMAAYKHWKSLQLQHNLPAAYNAREASRYSSVSKAVFKVLKLIEEELAARGITDLSNTEHIKEIISREEQQEIFNRDREIEAARRASLEERQRESEALRLQQSHHQRTQQPESRSPHDPEGLIADLSQVIDNPELIDRLANSMKHPDFMARANAMGAIPTHENNEDENENLVDTSTEYDVMVERVRGENWDQYAGWTNRDKEELIEGLTNLRIVEDEDRAERILIFILLRGQPSSHLKSTLGDTNMGPDVKYRAIERYLDGFDMYMTDEEAFKSFYPALAEQKSFKSNKFQDTPQDIETLAWQMAFQGGHEYDQSGAFPMFKRGVHVNNTPEGKVFNFVEKVRQDNMVNWLREHMMELHGLQPDSPVNFIQHVDLKKTFSPINVIRMLENKATMFRSKHGNQKQYDNLAGQFEREATFFQITREFKINYMQNYGDEKKLQEARLQQFYLNILTKPLYGKSFFYWIHMMPEAYSQDHFSDSKMGAAINTMFMAYNHLTNPHELKRVLHVKDLNEIFHKKKFEAVLKQLADKRKTSPELYCDLSKFSAAFNEDGSLKMGDGGAAFIELVNFYTQNTPDENLKNIIRTIIKERATELHGLIDSVHGEEVSFNKNMAELMAYDMSWFMGVGTINDVKNAGFNAEVRAGDAYRLKQLTGRGGKWGNLWTIGQFKRWLIMPMHAIRTNRTEKEFVMKDGKTVEVNGNPKTIFEEMDEISRMRVGIDAVLTEEVNQKIASGEYAQLIADKMRHLRHGHADKPDAELEAIAIKEVKQTVRDQLWRNRTENLKEYKIKADEFIFPENASRNYYLNHYARGFQLDERLRGAKDVRFDKFITHDPLLGAVFRQEDYQKEMSSLITAARYAFQTYGELNYDMPIWAWDPNLYGKGKGGMRMMPLGQSMFGHQLVNIPKLSTNGVVDWAKVNTEDGKKILFKRWVETFIVGQILQYRAITKWGSHPRYSFAMLEDILNAISKIPSGLDVDETDMRAADYTGYFFDKKAIERIRKESGTGKLKVYLTEMFIRGIFGKSHDEGLLTGMGVGLGIFMTAIFKES